MDRARFWSLIDRIDKRALREDDTAAVAPLEHALAELDEHALAGFEEQLAQVLYALDGREFADQAGDSGGSDDGFLYARCFVVAQGERVYREVLAKPALMPKSIDEWCEALLYVAARAWARQKAGRDEGDWPRAASVSYETGSNTALWA